MKTILITIALTIAIVGAFAQTADYCKICSNHVACNNDGELKSTCPPKTEVIDLTDDLKNLILDIHNEYRNTVANGSIDGFAEAKRMARSQWDDELAYLASLNAKTCVMKHDSCFKTNTFQHAGQNLGSYSYSAPDFDVKKAIRFMIKYFYDEYKNCNQSIIDKYQSSSGPVYGHFTELVNEKNTHLGCGITYYSKGGLYTHYMACNYARTNIIGSPIYRKGPSCSGCSTGCDSKFDALCSVKEEYDVNGPN